MTVSKRFVLYSGLALLSAGSTAYAQLDTPREVRAFSYDVQFFEYDENGAKKYTHTDHYAVRGDGSTASVNDIFLAKMGERRVTVNDYTKRLAWTTSLLGRTVTTRPMAEHEVPQVHVDECDEGEVSTVGRYEVRKERLTVRNRESKVLFIVDSWRAPELGCVQLRTVMYDKVGNPRHDRVATTIVMGEPDPVLFEVPEGYRERSPLDAHQELVNLGAAPPFQGIGLALMERAERGYGGEPDAEPSGAEPGP